MKKLYFICVLLIVILSFLYVLKLTSMGFGAIQCAVLFAVFAVTAGIGLLIAKLFISKISKNMEDN